MPNHGAGASSAGAVGSIRAGYQRDGVESFYRRSGDNYRNPHEGRVRAALALALERHPLGRDARILDLCCGSGEVTLQLLESGFHDVVGADPFTGRAYLERTGRTALNVDFEDIANGALSAERYDLVVCSFALHLVERSRLPRLVWQLSRSAPALVVLTPHKRPRLDPRWGFGCVEECVVARVRIRVYRRT